jgi:metal-sulfur cluster biosynthetic enzyme
MHPLLHDVVRRATSADSTSFSEASSAGHWHHAVREASARTTHQLAAADTPRDVRYGSDDADLDRLWIALGEVADPELPISLVDLGLICDIRKYDRAAEVDVTFTATACPCIAFITADIRDRLLQEADVDSVTVRDVWDPPWNTDRMTAHGKALLKTFGIAA